MAPDAADPMLPARGAHERHAEPIQVQRGEHDPVAQHVGDRQRRRGTLTKMNVQIRLVVRIAICVRATCTGSALGATQAPRRASSLPLR